MATIYHAYILLPCIVATLRPKRLTILLWWSFSSKAALMPTGPADIYFTKALHATRNLSIVVSRLAPWAGSRV